MKYTQADYIRLMTAVEEQGGAHLDETCAKDEIEYPMPDGKTKIDHTHGCENETLFDVMYEPGETVMVPQPILEVDPTRSPFTSLNGETRHVTRSVKSEDEEGNETVVFEVVQHEGELSEQAFPEEVRVCAVADNVGMWPRFQHAIRDAESK